MKVQTFVLKIVTRDDSTISLETIRDALNGAEDLLQEETAFGLKQVGTGQIDYSDINWTASDYEELCNEWYDRAEVVLSE